MDALPPPPRNVIILAGLELAIYAILLPANLFVAWKHGAKGITAWLFLSTFIVLRLVADAYQIAKRHEPAVPNAVSITTSAGSIACVNFLLIGLKFEANLFARGKARWTEKIVLGVMHLVSTAGIAVATFGGSPSEKKRGPMNPLAEQIGYILMLAVLVFLCLWAIPTFSVINKSTHQSSCRAARVLMIAALCALPIQLVRIIYQITFAFTRIHSLDPSTGTFSMRLVFIFLTQLGVAIVTLVGGFLSLKAQAS